VRDFIAFPDEAAETAPLQSVTVIVPVYNGQDFIERTIRSAAAQDYPRIEILVVDDGSTDSTASILDRLARELPRVRYVTIPNGGVANARNYGTELAETDYVAYLDGDDLWHPSKITRQVEALSRHGDDESWAACYALFRRIDGDDRLIANGAVHLARGDILADHLRVNHVGNGSSLLVRRRAALDVGGFDPAYAARGIGGCEDFDFQLRLLKKYKMEVVPEYLVGYRFHESCMSRNHRAMAMGYLATVENALDGAQVTARDRKKALAAAHDYVWWRLLVDGEPVKGLKSLVAQLRAEPLALIPRIAERTLRQVAKLVRRLLPDASRPVKPLFVDLDPLDGVPADVRNDAGRSLPGPALRTIEA
jgi:glycosyltransferase involved in cell wall biosynthesis